MMIMMMMMMSKIQFLLILLLIPNFVSSSQNKRFCLSILRMDCSVGFVPNVICGSDGFDYPNDCAFSKGMCQKSDLLELHKGPCVVTTDPPPTTTTTTPEPTTEPPTTTIDFVGNRFCKTIMERNCNGLPNELICGTDGQTYQNDCLFSKAMCLDLNLDENNRGPCVQTTTFLEEETTINEEELLSTSMGPFETEGVTQVTMASTAFSSEEQTPFYPSEEETSSSSQEIPTTFEMVTNEDSNISTPFSRIDELTTSTTEDNIATLHFTTEKEELTSLEEKQENLSTLKFTDEQQSTTEEVMTSSQTLQFTKEDIMTSPENINTENSNSFGSEMPEISTESIFTTEDMTTPLITTESQTEPPVTTTERMSTVDFRPIIKDFFCTWRWEEELNCDPSFKDYTCANDNRTYRTRCDLAKAHCDYPNLQVVFDGICPGDLYAIEYKRHTHVSHLIIP